MATFAVLFALLWIIEPYIQKESVFDDEYYAPIVEEFERLTSLRYSERRELLHQYYPGDELSINEYALSTIDDTLDEKTRIRILSAHNSQSKVNGPNNVRSDIFSNDTYQMILVNPDNLDRNAIELRDSVRHQRVIGTKVNINTATLSELMRLPGVGQAIALRIIEYRETNGRFSRIEDIMKVRGIGPARFESLKNMLEV